MGFWQEVLFRYVASLLQALGGLLMLAGAACLGIAGVLWYHGVSDAMVALTPGTALWVGLALLLLGGGFVWWGFVLLRLVRRKPPPR